MTGWARLLDWHADPVVVLGLSAMGAGLALMLRAARRRGATVDPSRVRWLVVAVATLVLALLSPLATLSEEHFSVHMVQHLLLLYVATPALALAAPVTLALQAAGPGATRRRLLAALHSRWLSVLSHPVLTWTLFASVMYLTHFSSLYDAALRQPLVHGAEHLLYLATSALFWWPVVRRDPVPGGMSWPARLLYLLLAFPLQSFLGVAIYSSDRVLYDSYLAFGTRAAVLADQQLAGAIMWVGGDLLNLLAIGLAVAAWMRHEDRSTARLDARLDALRAERDDAASSAER